MMNYQLNRVVVSWILKPLSRSLAESLETLIYQDRAAIWFTIFLCNCILLYNYEADDAARLRFWEDERPTSRRYATINQCDRAKTRNEQDLYPNLQMLGVLHAGAQTLVAHLPFVYKNRRPFDSERSSDETFNSFTELDKEQLRYLQFVADTKHTYSEFADELVLFATLCNTDYITVEQWRRDHENKDYKAEGYLVSQLFEPG